MSLSLTLQAATCFNDQWPVDKRLTAMIRKLGFLELNKYLKDKNVMTRYKRNVDLKEIFDSNYAKTVSSMIRELIEHQFVGIDLAAIKLDKKRGSAVYSIQIRLPTNERTFRPWEGTLQGLRHLGFLDYIPYYVQPGRTLGLEIYFGNLPVTANSVASATSTLPVFVESLTTLAAKVKEIYPLVVVAPPAPAPAPAPAETITVLHGDTPIGILTAITPTVTTLTEGVPVTPVWTVDRIHDLAMPTAAPEIAPDRRQAVVGVGVPIANTAVNAIGLAVRGTETTAVILQRTEEDTEEDEEEEADENEAVEAIPQPQRGTIALVRIN